MPPENWDRIKAIFTTALDAPADARPSLVSRLCGGDDALRREVESLLRFAAADPEPPAPPGGAPDEAPAPLPSRIESCRLGPYRLVRELGHGGMGAVYHAHRDDGQFQQDVAIKIIRHLLAGPDLERRFRIERQILASLNHPHIARLLDGGVSESGEPYLVMELVTGEPLLTHAARAALGLRDRLALFLRVCSAVSYAHGKLVVHRDIKPSNILVTGAGEPKLLDFGLAKIADATAPEPADSQTVTMFRAYTPSYASPEQVLGQPITTASDVYSLGVVLYELLSGALPFQASRSAVADVVRALDETEPARPSTVRPEDAALPYPHTALDGDLDNIVLMALRRDPERRYPSVAALMHDIECYLASVPISARPHTVPYRAIKFARRHATAVAAIAVATIALVAGLGVSLWQAAIARDERDRATRRFEDVRRLSNSLLFELSPRIERLSGATDARDVLVQRALEYLDSLATESSDDWALQSELAAAYEKVGDLQGNPTNPNLIELDAALDSYTKAQAIRARVAARRPGDAGAQRALAENRRVLGNVLSQANEFARAETEFREALALYDALARANPADRALQLALAQTTHDVGRHHSNGSRYAGALAPFERAIALTEALLATSAGDVEVLRLLGETRTQYGLALSWEGRQRDGEAEVARAAAIYEGLVQTHPDDVAVRTGLWSVYWITSIVYEEVNDPLSHRFAEQALDVITPLTAQDPSNVRARQQLAKSFSRLGQTATNIGQPTQAVEHLATATRLLGAIVAGESRNGRLRSEYALALTRLADARGARGQMDAAIAEATRAAGIYESVLRAFPGDRRSVRNLVLAHQLIAEFHERQSDGASPASRQHRQLAAARYRQALDLMLGLRAQRMLADVDDKLVRTLQEKVETLATASDGAASRSAS